MRGGLAESTGLLGVNDEILEVNGIDVAEKSLDQVSPGPFGSSSSSDGTSTPVSVLFLSGDRHAGGQQPQPDRHGETGRPEEQRGASRQPKHLRRQRGEPTSRGQVWRTLAPPPAEANANRASRYRSSGDSEEDEEEEDGDLILENECLTPPEASRSNSAAPGHDQSPAHPSGSHGDTITL